MKESLNILKPYLRGWPIIVGAMIIFFLGAKKYLSYVAPMYESTVKIRLADNEQSIPSANLYKDFDVFSTKQKIDAEIEVIQSDIILEKAIQKVPVSIQKYRVGSFTKTEIYDDSPFKINVVQWAKEDMDTPFTLSINQNNEIILKGAGDEASGLLGDTLTINMSTALITINHDFIASKTSAQITGEYEFTVLSKEKAIALIKSNISVASVDKEVPIIRISVKSAHPQKAADLSNAIAKAYIEDYIDKKSNAAELTVSFLDDRIAEISKDLAQSEERILNFRNLKSITNLNQETETELRRIAKLKVQQTNMQMNLEAVRELEKYIDNGQENFLDLATNFEAFNDLLSTEIIKNIKKLQAKKRELLLDYTEDNEEVKIIDDKIKDLTSYLVESIRNTRKNLEVKNENLAIDLKLAEDNLSRYPLKEQVLNQLKREFEIYQQSYTFLNQKRIEAEIAKAAKISFHRIIAPAKVNETPISPNKAIIKIVAAILGLFLSIAFIFIVHTLKARVNNVTTVESKSLLPIAATIPKFKTPHQAEDFYLTTLSQWEVKGFVQPKSIINLSSFAVEEGSQYSFENILSVLLLQQKKVLVIDCTSNNSLNASFTPETKTLLSATYSSIELPASFLKTKDTQFIQDKIVGLSKKFDQTLILNSSLESRIAIPLMAISNFNLIIIDSRITRAKKIDEMNLVAEEYQLPNLYVALNRAHYNPNIIVEVIKIVKRKMKALKK